MHGAKSLTGFKLCGFTSVKKPVKFFCFLAIIFFGSIVLTSQWLLCIHCFTSMVRFTAPNNTQEHSTGCETDATRNIQQFWELCGQKCCVRWHGALHAIITDNRLKFIEAHTVIQPKREYQSTLRYQFLKFEIN